MSSADETAVVVVLVELKATCADVPASRPGVDRVVERSDSSAVLVEGHVAANQVAAVGESTGVARRLRHQQQSSGFDCTAREDEDIGLLLEDAAVSILVYGAGDPARLVDR